MLNACPLPPHTHLAGHVGLLHVTIPWFSFRSSPITITVEDVFLLAKAKDDSDTVDPAEEERREQEIKQDKLRNAESLDQAAQAGKNVQEGQTEDERQTWLGALTSKLVDNVQVRIKNIHLRYEDDQSTPEHPFAAGITLSSFTAVSTDENWVEAFIQNSVDGVHKLANLDGLSIYFDTDANSIYRGPDNKRDMLTSFMKQIASKDNVVNHQYVLKPVSGEARTILRKKHSQEKPKMDTQVFFDEIGFILDDDQYRDALSMVDLFHFHTRTRQYHKFRLPGIDIPKERPKALWKFATAAIRSEIHERHRKWSWDYFKERRDVRKTYVELFLKFINKTITPEDQAVLNKIELELSYEDIRFFRSVARAQARKDAEVKRRLEEEKAKHQPQQAAGWFGWVWGGPTQNENHVDGEPMITEDDRKQLNEIIDYDATAASMGADVPKDFRLMHIQATLKKGTFVLRRQPHGSAKEIVSLEFQTLSADVTQYPETLDAITTLGSFSVFDGTAPNTLYPQIVRVKQAKVQEQSGENPFFTVRFERNPLDGRADTGLTVKMRHLEIFYHRVFVEEIMTFFRPPPSQVESINALLDAAGQTLEGIRKVTRAGLEYALEQHKTIDMQVDMNAPIIIIPEDVTKEKSLVLVLDAGHIAVTSNLADQKQLDQLHSKRGQQYSEKDTLELEQLMYDRFTIRLDNAQLLIGDNLEACTRALDSQDRQLHIVERINMAFEAQNAIVNAPTLTRFKVSGELPVLTLNASDTKYKSLMRIIDIAVPHFGGDDTEKTEQRPALHSSTSNAFRSYQVEEYVLSDDSSSTVHGDDEADESMETDADQFYEAKDGTTETQRLAMKRNNFQFCFAVKQLRANLSRSTENGTERPLAAVSLNGFGLDFAQRQYDMSVQVVLKALTLEMTGERESHPIITSEQAGGSEDLVVVHYIKVQKTSPEFLSVHEGVDQSIEANVSTLRILAEPEPVLALYDFIMTTFVPEHNQNELPEAASVQGETPEQSDKLRIRVKLRSISLSLQDDWITFATLTLSAGDVGLLMRAGTMRLTASVGSLSLLDETNLPVADPAFKQLLAIEGKELADFTYETFDPTDHETFPGYNSMVKLRSGSLKLTFMEQPIRQINNFLVKLAQLKAVYDAASQAAIQRASEVTRMRFDIIISSPIVVLPRDGRTSTEIFYARLGEISTHNEYFKEGVDDSRLTASLTGISISTARIQDHHDEFVHVLDDTDVKMEVRQRTKEAVKSGSKLAEMDISGSTNIFKLTLTQYQYAMLMDVVSAVPKALHNVDDTSSPDEEEIALESLQEESTEDTPLDSPTQSETSVVSTKMSFAFEVPGVTLELFDAVAKTNADLDGHSIAQFKLSTVKVKYDTKSDGSSEATVALKAFSISNTRAGRSVHRELISEIGEGKDQVFLQYTTTGGVTSAAQLLLTIDSPHVQLAADPLSALLEFATSPYKGKQALSTPQQEDDTDEEDLAPPTSSGTFSYRVEIIRAAILVLADDSEENSQAITLNLNNAVLTQQAKMTLLLHGLGMSFGRMGHPEEVVSFLDDLDVTVALDTSTTNQQSQMSIDLMVQPVIIRASLNDILLVSDIVNKASVLATKAFGNNGEHSEPQSPGVTANLRSRRRSSVSSMRRRTLAPRSQGSMYGRKPSQNQTAKVLVSRESLNASFEGFQLVLVSDVQQLPTVHLITQPFRFQLQDWSGDMNLQTTLSTAINYYNLRISHWEPLMDPWDFTLRVGKTANSSGGTLAATFVSKRRLEMNASAAFIELAITTLTVWNKEGNRIIEQGRGIDAPFLVRNRTGYPILIWSDSAGNQRGKSVEVKRVADGNSIPWRFQDYKKLRDNISSSSHNALGVQLENTPWERVRNISVDREGDYPYILKPRLQKVAYRIVCDIQLKNNVKIITFRSTFKIENLTHLPMELVMIDSHGKAASSIYQIPPGDDCPLPIEAAYGQRFRLRPDRGFNFSWSGESYSWQDFMKRPVRAIVCKHRTPAEASFRFQAATLYDKNDPLTKSYPKLSVRLRAPVEIENLLPFNIRYRVYDKNTRSNTTSFLIKGGCSPIHTVDLEHLLLLSVDAQDSGFKPSEFAIINTDNPDDFRTEDTLVLEDKNKAKLDLKLHYFTYPDSGGAFKVQVYSPYVLLNKTGLPINLATQSWSGQKGIAGLDNTRGPEVKPLMMSFPSADRKDKLLIKFGNSEWSRPLSMESVAGDFEVRVATTIDGQSSPEMARGTMHTGFSYTEGLGKYKLSKVITLTPRFLLRNDCGYPIKLRQYRTHMTTVMEPGKRTPWYTFAFNAPPQFVLAFDGISAPWSAPINVADVGKMHVLVRQVEGPPKLIKVDTRLDGATVFLYFSEETGRWPLRLKNETGFTFKFCQTEDRNSTGLAQDRQMLTLGPNGYVDYTWDSPAADGKRIRLQAGDHERIVDIMEIGIQPPFKFAQRTASKQSKTQAVSLDVRAENSSQVLVIANYNAEESVYKPKASQASLARTESVDSLNAMSFETVAVNEQPTFTLSINFEGIGISIVNIHLQELVYISFRGIKIAYSIYPQYYDANLDCKWIQIDNQLFGGLFPIILYPTVVPKDGKELESHPTLQLSIAMLKDDQHGVTYVKYATILLQAMTIELDEDFLFALLEFSKFEEASWQEPTQDILIQNPGNISDPEPLPDGRNIYFEDLALQPLQLELSFMRTDRVNVDNKVSTHNPLSFFVNAITMALGNVNAAPVLLNALIVHNARLTLPSLQERVILHYREQAMAQLYRVLGSADFLGNPVGLFNNVSSGFQDIFYEPYQGMVLHGNKELGTGIARGATSFAKKSIFGVSDSLTKVTSSIGKGLSAATMDSDYQSKRRMAARRNKPKHALYGFATGANAFATSVASGFEGLALKPIEGAEAGGVGGFFKGIGKGFVGAVTKPMVGVVDFASSSFEGIRNTTTVLDENDIDRVRLPRFIAEDGILRPFNEREALGQSWLKDLENGKYFNENYVAHLDLTGDDSVLILTTTRILLIRSTTLRVLWEVPFEELQTISLEPGGIGLVLRGDVGGPFVPVAEASERGFLFKHIEA